MFISCFLRVSVEPRKAHSELYRGRDTTYLTHSTFCDIFFPFPRFTQSRSQTSVHPFDFDRF